jgi:Schlafen, AlbA_2
MSYEAAFAAFFYGVVPSNLASQQPLWRIRRLDHRAWLHRVTVAPTTLTVIVQGSEAGDAELQLTTPTSMVTHRVGPTGQVRFPLPDGLADSTLLALIRNGDWLDYRHFADPARGDRRDESVVWDKPGADLQLLLNGGEGPTVEFKRQLPAGNGRETKRTALKTVAAFATGAGGTVLYGVDDTTAEPVGLDTATMSIERQRDRLVNMIRDCVDPEPSYDLQVAQVDGRTLLVLQVHAGGHDAYALFPEHPEFYVRRGASTFRARQQDIEAAFQRPDSGAIASFYWGPGSSHRLA